MPENDPHPVALLGDGGHHSDDEVRLLVEEYSRLRAEVEALRRERKQPADDRPKDQPAKDGKKEAGDQNEKDEGGKEEDKKEEKPKPPLRQRIKTWSAEHPVGLIMLIVGFIALLIAGALLWRYLESFESTDDAEVEGHINQISSRISGNVVAVNVENAQSVKKGEVLVTLDPSDYSVAISQARANLGQAQSNVEVQNPNVPITTTTQSTLVSTTEQDVVNAEAGLAAAERSYEASLADVRQAEADAANAATEEVRYRELVAKDEVSHEMYDQRATTSRAQQALVASRRAAAEANRKAVDQRGAQLKQAQQRAEEAKTNLPRQVDIQRASVRNRQAAAQVAKAQLDQALLNLKYTKIVSPVDGIVGDRTVEIGMQVSPGQEMLAITQIDDLWVTANFKETQVRKMHAGQSVTIHVDTLAQDFDGYIENLPGATGALYSLLPPENATGNYVKVVQRLPVRIRFKPNQKNENRLRPGMSVEPKVWVE